MDRRMSEKLRLELLKLWRERIEKLRREQDEDLPMFLRRQAQ